MEFKLAEEPRSFGRSLKDSCNIPARGFIPYFKPCTLTFHALSYLFDNGNNLKVIQANPQKLGSHGAAKPAAF